MTVPIITTGITTTNLLVTGLISTANLVYSTATVGTLKATGITAGALLLSGALNCSGGSVTINNGNVLNILNNGMATGGVNDLIYLDQGLSSNNSAILDFNYIGSGSTSNSVGLGFFSANNKLVVQASGNVGINNTNPGYTFDVSGNARVTSNMIIQGTGTGTSGTLYFNDNNKGIQYSGTNSGTNYFGTNFPTDGIAIFGWVDGTLGTKNPSNKCVLNWNNSGNVGINTTSPGYALDVNGGSRLGAGSTVTYQKLRGSFSAGTLNAGQTLYFSFTFSTAFAALPTMVGNAYTTSGTAPEGVIVGFYSLTTSGFSVSVANKHTATLTTSVNWIAEY